MKHKVIHFIDHYDSFSFNLVDWLKCAPYDWHVKHHYFDTPGLANYLEERGEPLVFSPGPKSPEEAFQSVDLARRLAGRVPMLGVCLGHQIFAKAYGGLIVKAKHPVHGERRRLHIEPGSLLFRELRGPISVALYNSLVVKINQIQDCRVTALNEDGEVHAVEYFYDSVAPSIGVQFHPESFLMGPVTQQLRLNWFKVLEKWHRLESSKEVEPPDSRHESDMQETTVQLGGVL